MQSMLSRLASGVSFIALVATMPIASAGVITALNVSPVINAPGNVAEDFIGVGSSGTGSLTVDNGSILTMAPGLAGDGQINIGDAQIGSSGNVGTGTVTVSGAGSRIDFTGPLSIFNVGRWGTTSQATLNILAGGSVNMTAGSGMRVGRGNTNAGFGTDGARGEVRVDGIGSRLSITGVDDAGAAPGLVLGRDGGSGKLTVSNGGAVEMNTSSTNSSVFLNLGGRAVGSDPTLAASSGRGEAIVTGIGSRLTLGGDGASITVGNFGSTSTASLQVTNGGTVTVDASQATQSGGGFTIGRDGGTGTLALETGGSLRIFGNALGGMGLTAGRNGGSGNVTVGTGASILIETPTGATTSGSSITLGRDAGTTGTMRVDGGTVTLDINHDRNANFRSAVLVGRGGTGTLDIVNGGVMTLDGAAARSVAVTAGGNYSSDPANRVPGIGRINVTGAGSKLDLRGVDGSIEIGRWGSTSRGELVVSGGGAVGANTLYIGVGQNGSDGATGRVEITGAGSSIALAGKDFDGDGGQIWVAREGGTGQLLVTGGARMLLDGSLAEAGRNAFINIGGRAPSIDSNTNQPVAGSIGNGSVIVDGANSTIGFVGVNGVEGGGGSINVGRWGTATDASMEIRNGGQVTTSFVSIGRGDAGADGSRGRMLVDNGQLKLTGVSSDGTGAFLSVGRDAGGRGSLSIVNGGVVTLDPTQATSPTGTVGVTIARGAGSTGDVTLDGNARLDASQFLGVGAHIASLVVQEGGAGTLTLRNNSVARAQNVQIGANASVTVASNSSLLADQMVLRGGGIPGGSRLALDGGTVGAATLDAFAGAVISGNGTLNVATVTLHDGAVLNPGFSAGLLSFTGNLVTLPGSKLVLDFIEGPDGTISHDLLQIAGLLSAGAEVEILLGGSATFDDIIGRSLSLFLADDEGAGLGHSYDGRFVSIIGTAGTWRRLSVLESLIVDGGPDTAVPTPGTLSLLLLSNGLLGWLRRRRA